jgi:2',3'-cyclic-nucleotide 2'-phosphodiesterase (5'-nucleotidase family)
MPQGGLARRASAIKELRQNAQGSLLLLDSGDSIFGHPGWIIKENSQKGTLLIHGMNAMDYDAMALGTMDLAPVSVATARFEELDFPILSANARPGRALPNLQAYLLRKVEGHTIAIIGVTAPVAEESAQAYATGLTMEDPVAAIQRTVKKVRARAGVIILLGNLDPEMNIALAQEVPGIDAIIGVYKSGDRRVSSIDGPEGTVVLQASGTQGEHLGVLSLRLDAAGKVVSFSGQALALTANRYPDDPEMSSLLLERALAE